MTENTVSRHYERGRIVNRYLRDRLRQYEAGAQDETIEESLLGAYLDHQVRKRLFQYLITGTNGGDPFGHLIHIVVQLAFSILLSQERDELEDAMHIRTSFYPLPLYAQSTEPPALGGLGLGSTSALGFASADAGSVAHVDIDLSDKQLVRLYHYPWTLRHLLRAFDTVVPIDFDFRIRFRLRPHEGSFRLVGEEDGYTPMLGMTTSLAG